MTWPGSLLITYTQSSKQGTLKEKKKSYFSALTESVNQSYAYSNQALVHYFQSDKKELSILSKAEKTKTKQKNHFIVASLLSCENLSAEPQASPNSLKCLLYQNLEIYECSISRLSYSTDLSVSTWKACFLNHDSFIIF